MDDSSVQWEALEQLQQWMRIPGSHLKELRRRLAVSLGVFVISLVLGMVGAEPVFAFLKRTGPAAALELHAFSPWDSIQVYMQVAGVVALLVTLPFLGLQLWLFARPGLTNHAVLYTLRSAAAGSRDSVRISGGISDRLFLYCRSGRKYGAESDLRNRKLFFLYVQYCSDNGTAVRDAGGGHVSYQAWHFEAGAYEKGAQRSLLSAGGAGRDGYAPGFYLGFSADFAFVDPI